MRQGSTARGVSQLRVVSVAIRNAPDDRWPAWASLLFIAAAGLASWTAILLTGSSLAG